MVRYGVRSHRKPFLLKHSTRRTTNRYTDCDESKGWIPPKDCPGIYESFGKGCGVLENHTVRLYTSHDLDNFTKLSDNVLTDRPEGIYFRPKVIYNEKTKLFVLWVNYLPPKSTPLASYPDATFLVATSSTPQGPYTVVTQKANISQTGGGDFTVMIDPKDGVAYIAYDAWGNSHRVLIEELNENFTDSLGASTSTGPLSPSSHEAPILFERNKVYYLMYGHTCCFCSTGAGSSVMTAPSPKGPWQDMNYDINPKKGFFDFDYTIQAQENFVITLPSGEYVYTGDRWTSAPDKKKSHDFQYWQLLTFNDTVSPPKISKLSWVDSFELKVWRIIIV